MVSPEQTEPPIPPPQFESTKLSEVRRAIGLTASVENPFLAANATPRQGQSASPEAYVSGERTAPPADLRKPSREVP